MSKEKGTNTTQEYITVDEHNIMAAQWNEAMNLLNSKIDFLKGVVKKQSERLDAVEKNDSKIIRLR